MAKNKLTYPPLTLLNDLVKEYPDIWRQAEDFHSKNGKDGLPAWPQWCYIPIAAGIAIATQGQSFANNPWGLFNHMKRAQDITAVAAWRISKDVFVMDPDMEELLYEQEDDIDLSPEIFLQLPYYCFYVQTSRLEIPDFPIHGFFVHLEYDVNNGDRELRLLFLSQDGKITMAFPIHIDEANIRASVVHTIKESHQNIRAPEMQMLRQNLFAQSKAENIERLEELLKKALQLVLYLCAQNKEVAANPEQRKMKKAAVTKDRYAEVRKWDVGIRIGAAVRQYNVKKAETTQDKAPSDVVHKAHASPRPHIRRAHWHNFWTGPKDGDRKLVLKWLAPSFVGTNTDDTPVVIHKVKTPKEEPK